MAQSHPECVDTALEEHDEDDPREAIRLSLLEARGSAGRAARDNE
jgi:hypothetical protein